MAAGTYIKALVLVLVSLMVFGFASSTMVHNQIWDGVKTVLGEFGPEGDGDDGGDEGGTTFYEYPLSVSYNLTQTMTVQPTGTVDSFYYRTPMPVDSWSATSVQVMHTMGMVDSTGFNFDDSSVPGWANLTYDAPFDTDFPFTLYFNFTSYFAIWNLTPEMSGTLNDIPEWYNDTYVKDQEWFINGNKVGINQSQSMPAVSGAFPTHDDNVLSILHAAYMWVIENIDYYTIPGGDLKNVSTTIQEEKGDCDDMSTLLISMVRYMGVPAWLEQGVLYNSNTDSWEHHAWVQAYVPLANGSHVNITIDPTNQQFALFSPNKFIVYTDLTGDGTRMGEYYNFMGFTLSSGTVSVQVNLDSTYYSSSGNVQVPSNHSTW